MADYNPSLTPVLNLLGELGERTTVHDLAVSKPGLRLFVRRHEEGAAHA